MSTNSIIATITSNVDARGLAIIVTNDYRNCTSLSSLPGTFIDGENMKDTFQLHLNFVVHWEQNITYLQLTKLIHEACNFQDYHNFKKYKCIVFVFSGHGDLGDIVYLQDGSEVSIGEDIIKPFLPKASPIMGKFQKLFFFDACRGKKESESVMVPRSGKAKGGYDNSLTFEHRGGSVIERIRVPGEGGFLVAYSTMSNHLAWEGNKGGAWLQKLAEEIRINTTSSIEDVLTKVNSDLIKDPTIRVQQPEKLSRLNEVVFLHPEKDPKTLPKIKIAAVFPTQPTPSLDRTQPLNSIQPALLTASPGVYQGAMDSPAMKQLISQYPSAAIRKLKDYPHNPPEHENITYYRSQVTITLFHQDIVGDSKKYFLNTQISREEAIKDAILQVSLQETSSSYLGLSYSSQPQQVESPIQQSAASPCPTYGTSSCAPNPNSLLVPTLSQQGHDRELSPPANSPQSPAIPGHYHRQRVNRFFQENNINPRYIFDSEIVPTTQHRCIVCYTIQGESREVDSVRYYSSKGDAKEQVAKLVLERENVSQIVSKGIAPPSNKVWKSKLKEYCDKNKIVVAMKYHTKSSGIGFKSTVTFLGRDIEGEECKSKQEAEQSAAHNALQSVQLN